MNLISSLKIKQIESTCKRFKIASSISISISNCINNVHHETRVLTVFRIKFYFWPKSKLSSKFNIPLLTCSVWNKYYYYNFQRQFQHIKTMCGGRIVDTTLDGVGYSRSQHPRTRLSPLSWETRSGCSAFETGLIRAGVLRRCTKSVE